MNLRISSGQFKNKRLKVPESAMPVRERVKMAVFSIIGEQIINSQCLDIFAGSGNLGLEAMSIGAKSCMLLDTDYHAIEAILANKQSIIESFRQDFEERIQVKRDDAVKYTANTTEHYDIIFIDPPYDLPINHIFKLLDEILNPNGLIIYFHSKTHKIDLNKLNPHLKINDTRTYGVTEVDFIDKS